MPTSKMTATDSANGSVVKKFRFCFLPSSNTAKSRDSSPFTMRPELSFTMTGTITWFTLLLSLNSSSLAGSRPPGWRHLRDGLDVHGRRSDAGSVGRFGQELESADAAGFDSVGGAWFGGGGPASGGGRWTAAERTTAADCPGNGRLAEGASGMSSLSGCSGRRLLGWRSVRMRPVAPPVPMPAQRIPRHRCYESMLPDCRCIGHHGLIDELHGYTRGLTATTFFGMLKPEISCI